MFSTRLWRYFLLLLVCLSAIARIGNAGRNCPPYPIGCAGISGDQRWGKRSFLNQIRNATPYRSSENSRWNADKDISRIQLSDLLRRLQEETRH